MYVQYRLNTPLPEQDIHPSVYSKTKRLIDIIGALVGLAITALIFPAIALLIYVDDPGSIFFRQIRCGVNGKTFRMWKFRSMVMDAEKIKHLVENKAHGHIFKNDQDPRITRIGKFLRRTSLDEFPQFWNVLKGEMSLVGTRPPTLDEVAKYESHHYQRLRVKPGITGEWQANGRSDVEDFEEMVSMDIAYQRKWNRFYDLRLIGKTVWVVLRQRGAS